MGWASNRIQHHSGGVCIAAVMSATIFSNFAFTVEPLYYGHLGDVYSKVSCIERCPHFRGKFLLMGHIAKCP